MALPRGKEPKLTASTVGHAFGQSWAPFCQTTRGWLCSPRICASEIPSGGLLVTRSAPGRARGWLWDKALTAVQSEGLGQETLFLRDALSACTFPTNRPGSSRCARGAGAAGTGVTGGGGAGAGGVCPL